MIKVPSVSCSQLLARRVEESSRVIEVFAGGAPAAERLRTCTTCSSPAASQRWPASFRAVQISMSAYRIQRVVNVIQVYKLRNQGKAILRIQRIFSKDFKRPKPTSQSPRVHLSSLHSSPQSSPCAYPSPCPSAPRVPPELRLK